jgi:hypothetical protein
VLFTHSVNTTKLVAETARGEWRSLRETSNAIILTEQEYKACHTWKCTYDIGYNVGSYSYHDINGDLLYHLGMSRIDYRRQYIYHDLKQAGLL